MKLPFGTGWRERLTFANVASLLALFVALGGTGYAATALPANSVGNAQLKPDSVGSGKVRDGSLKAVDFKSGELPAGARGATGPAGAAGAAGPAGTVKATVTVVATGSIPGNTFGSATATCPSGYQAVGGGGEPQSVATMVVTATQPVIDGQNLSSVSDGQHAPATAWRVFFLNNIATPQTGKAAVICAPLG